MQYIIYLDTFFLINFYMDYIILLMVSVVLKYTTTHLFTRRLLGAAVGALYACLILLLGLDGIVWKMISYFGIVMLMSFILNGKNGIRQIIKGSVYIYFFSCALGGIMHVLYYYTFVGYFMYEGAASTVMLLIGATIVVPAILKTVKNIKSRMLTGNTRMTVIIENDGKKVELPALLDTGNSLMDPIFNQPVNIVECGCIQKILLEKNAISYHLIPFSSIGNESGLIPVVRFERLKILSDRGAVYIEKPFIALYSGKISGTGEYKMILHPEMLHNEINNRRDKHVFKSNDAKKISNTDDAYL